nr:protein exordium-like 3 [Tanacetum cinerariifolium]
VCAYPFAVPDYIPGLKIVKSPNGDEDYDTKDYEDYVEARDDV